MKKEKVLKVLDLIKAATYLLAAILMFINIVLTLKLGEEEDD